MANQIDIRYIDFSAEGNAARKFAPAQKKKVQLPDARRKTRRVLTIDPLALIGVAVAVCMIVFMGIGEGLLNFDELAKTLEILTAPEYFAMSPRRITVSTSGYIPGMERFARLKKEYNLAVSLHAVTDDIRAKLIPPNVRYAINDILDAADRCRDANGRQYTLEYTMISGINDDLASAEKLGAIAKAHHAKVNLIPYNSTGGEFRRPEKSVIEAFQQTVAATGARVTRRVERGGKKTAACGQLRIHHQNSGDDK